jgi:hypothetical protein
MSYAERLRSLGDLDAARVQLELAYHDFARAGADGGTAHAEAALGELGSGMGMAHPAPTS